MKEKDIKKLREIISGTIEVCSKPCNQCLFSKNKIVEDQRVKEILEQCEKDQTHFICHKGTIADRNLVCNGFYRNKTTPYLELMKVMQRVVLINPDTMIPESAPAKQQKNNSRHKKKRKKM